MKLGYSQVARFWIVRIGNLINQSATSCAISIPPLLEDCSEQKTFKDVESDEESEEEGLLFLIYVNDMPNPGHHQTDKSQFADDAGQWVVSKNIDLAAEYLQRDLDKLARWCAKWRIKLNPEKTKVIIFSKSRFAIMAEPALSLYGDARGKFVSGAKVLAAVPSMSQPKEFTRIDSTLAGWGRSFQQTLKYRD